MNRKLDNNQGFSLVEILVVVFIVMMAFIGVLMIVNSTIKLRYSNQAQLVAGELAREGLELVRSVRNDNWLNGRFWAYNISPATAPVADGSYKDFAIDYQSLSDSAKIKGFDYNINGNDACVGDCVTGANGNINHDIMLPEAQLFLGAPGRLYTVMNNLPPDELNITANKTIYHRLIKVIYHDNGTNVSNKSPLDDTETYAQDDYLYVISMVYWRDHGQDHFYSLSSYLYDYDWNY